MDASELLARTAVAVHRDPQARYPTEPPFHPHERFPEYPFDAVAGEPNRVYEGVRDVLLRLGLDAARAGTRDWNPLGELLRPGETVVLKPNYVQSEHQEGGDLFSIITHSSVLRPLIDYCYLALRGKGRIIVADAPQMDCDPKALVDRIQIESIQRLYREALGFEIEFRDLRTFWFDRSAPSTGGGSRNRFPLDGDPEGQVGVDLGRASALYPVNRRYYGADFNRDETNRLHHGETQIYHVARTILGADLVILVPKLKTHKKVGVTLNIKGLVGTTTNKNCLVHYSVGAPHEGGDEFPDAMLSARSEAAVRMHRLASDVLLARKSPLFDFLYETARSVAKAVLRPLGFRPGTRVVDAGNWYGNDSAWRMAVDLWRAFLYADREGTLHDRPMRRVFSVIDGITAGEAEGPLVPDARHCGVLVAGFNPAAVDLVATRLMGFDYRKLKTFQHLLETPALRLPDPASIRVLGEPGLETLLDPANRDPGLDLAPHPAWKGHVEL